VTKRCQWTIDRVTTSMKAGSPTLHSNRRSLGGSAGGRLESRGSLRTRAGAEADIFYLRRAFSENGPCAVKVCLGFVYLIGTAEQTELV